MSDPSFVVLPVSGSGAQPNKETAEIASTVQHALYKRNHPKPEHPGPFKQILAQPNSFYKYFNWEDPIRTLALYLGGIITLLGAHYLPLTQIALKVGVTTFGVVSVTEFASRLISDTSLSARARPKEYKKIPEPVLNAVLKDVHDFIQYGVVQAQRVVFGQDLDKTFAAFLGFFALFWLTKMVSPFWLAVIALTSIFIAPLVSSEQGRRAAQEASVRAQELASVGAEKGRAFGHDSKAKATELSSKGKQTAADLSTQARDTTSDISDTAAKNIKKLPQMGTNAVNETENMLNSTYRSAKEYITNPPAQYSNHTNGQSDGKRSVANGASNEVSHLSNSASGATERTVHGVTTSKHSHSDHQQYPVSSLPTQTDGVRTGVVTDTGARYMAAGYIDATHDMANRPRGVVQVTTDKA